MYLVNYTALADWATGHSLGEVLPHCRDVVGALADWAREFLNQGMASVSLTYIYFKNLWDVFFLLMEILRKILFYLFLVKTLSFKIITTESSRQQN